MRGLLSLALILGAFNPATCIGGPGSTPDSAYESFVDDLNRGEWNDAWSLLSSATQAQLTQRAQQLAAFRHQPAPKDGKDLAFGEPLLAHQTIDHVNVTERSQKNATLEVTDDKGGKQVIHVVQETGQWRVDLTHELQAADGK